MKHRLLVRSRDWPIAGEFRIARGAKSVAQLVEVEIEDAGHRGHGESVPYARYGETVPGVMADAQRLRPVEGLSGPWLPRFDDGFDLTAARDPDGAPYGYAPGAARNALDCALWDLEAKRTNTPAWRLAGVPEPRPRQTAFTLSLADPRGMATSALAHADKPILKMKLAGDGRDTERVQAVRAARSDAQIIVDANEGFDLDGLKAFAPIAADCDIALIEQPLPADHDGALEGYACPVPLCADESMHVAADLDGLAARYQAVNIKLDKTGGLTEALRAARHAQQLGLTVMVGCMVATSLAMAPAFLLESFAAFIDLDGPLLLDRDREPGIAYESALMHPPVRDLWG